MDTLTETETWATPEIGTFAMHVKEKGWIYSDRSGWIEVDGRAEWVDLHVISKWEPLDAERVAVYELYLPDEVFEASPARWDQLVELAEAGLRKQVEEGS